MGKLGLEASKGVFLGIDFGTTNCVVSIYNYDEDKIITVPIDGHQILPTVIQFDRYDSESSVLETYFGYQAKEAAIVYPESTITSIKRVLGSDEKIEIKVDDDLYTFKAEDIVAKILSYLKEKADEYLREELFIHGEFTGCVITVPANSTDKQKQRTKIAAIKAGFNEEEVFLRLEPAAAAIQYAMKETDEKKVLVYDFGGGTFDACILEIKYENEEPNMSILSTYGNNCLGGDDIDKLLMDKIYDEFLKLTDYEIDLFSENHTLKNQKMHILRMLQVANHAKERFSEVNHSKIVLAPFIQEPRIVNISIDFTIDEFHQYKRQHQMNDSAKQFKRLKDKSVLDLIDETIDCIDACLEMAELKETDIDEVFLVGGSSCLKAVKDKIKAKFNKEPYLSKISPAYSISNGAAYYSHLIMSDSTFGPKINEVTIHPVGLELSGRRFYKIISGGIPIPKDGLVIEGDKLLETNHDYMTSMPIVVYEDTMPEDHRLKFVYEEGMKRLTGTTLRGIPEKPKGIEKVKVIFKVSQDNILEVEAKSISTEGVDTILSVDELY